MGAKSYGRVVLALGTGGLSPILSGSPPCRGALLLALRRSEKDSRGACWNLSPGCCIGHVPVSNCAKTRRHKEGHTGD